MKTREERKEEFYKLRGYVDLSARDLETKTAGVIMLIEAQNEAIKREWKFIESNYVSKDEIVIKLKQVINSFNPDEGQPELQSCYNEWTDGLLDAIQDLINSDK